MGDKVKPDFSGYATKAGIKCADGRTIMPDAFKHQDTMRVPLVWQHNHSDAENVLGHAILENRSDGVYAYGYFNETPQGQNAKTLVEHKDITALSIFANGLVEKAKQVTHGMIRELSLVLAGANPGAFIDNLAIQHGDTTTVLEDEAVIFTGLTLEHAAPAEAEKADEKKSTDDEGPTVQEVYDSMTDDQKAVTDYMVGAALDHAAAGDDGEQDKTDKNTDAAKHSALEGDGSDKNTGKDGADMKRNIFEGDDDKNVIKHELTLDAVKGIVTDAMRGGSLHSALEGYMLQHGINDIEILFPDARSVVQTPEWDARRMDWVRTVLNGTRKTPFSRIKSIIADITHEEARARGYIKGNLKKEEFFGLTKRTTGPKTVYKKQKLDRDDIIDITDFDIVVWLWSEMRLMLDEELARAILIGDGRPVEDPEHAGQPNPDKINDPAGAVDGLGIRSILNDDDLYAATVYVNYDDANSTYDEVITAITRGMIYYKGSGSPTFFTTLPHLTEMLLLEDGFGRRKYANKAELAATMNVDGIVTVEVMEGVDDLIGIIVNLSDYTIGTDRGGEVTKFDDFDIDYNQYKYLLETRLSGALTKIRSALIVKKVAAAAALVKPVSPTFVKTTGVLTPPTTTGVTYKRRDTNATVTTGSPITLSPGQDLQIYAVPASASYYFADNVKDEWDFSRPSA